jgi:hypothetical protein
VLGGARLAVELDRRRALPGDELAVTVHVADGLDRVDPASFRWYVEASVSYRWWSGDIANRTRREVIVYNGP